MPRNDQVTRQWLLMQKLEQSHGATLQELAASLPEDFACHPRTIRRDLEALEAAHIPLVTERRNGHRLKFFYITYREETDERRGRPSESRNGPSSSLL